MYKKDFFETANISKACLISSFTLMVISLMCAFLAVCIGKALPIMPGLLDTCRRLVVTAVITGAGSIVIFITGLVIVFKAA